jgi:RHS repeat-associated protein
VDRLNRRSDKALVSQVRPGAPDPLTGTTVVTNLRLPGQYDERLFAAAGISGMQGPYYNWNRWYLPSMGRYLEPDPIAMVGGFNTHYGVDWYGYGMQNPLTNTDPTGLTDRTQLCESIAKTIQTRRTRV